MVTIPSLCFIFSVSIAEIKEIRLGKISKDFESSGSEAKKCDSSKCFVVYYGTEFRLKTLSVESKGYICFTCIQLK